MFAWNNPVGSRVAKRILLCFLVGAALPTAAMALYAYHAVASHRSEGTSRYLRRELTAIRMGVLDRLLLHKEGLEQVLDGGAFELDAGAGASGAPQSPRMWAVETPRGFRRAVIVDLGAEPGDSWTPTASPLRRAARKIAHAGEEGLRLTTVSAPSSERAYVFMGKLDHSREGLRRVIVAELDGEAFWSYVREGKLGRLRLRVEDARGHIIYASPAGTTPSGEDGEPLPVESGHLFLEPMFGCQGWVFTVASAQSIAGGPLRQFEIVFPLAIALTLGVVVLLSLHLVRRILGPLDQLRSGAERLAQGDLEARIRVGSGDELEELGRTFNTMADRLSRHVGLIETAAWIDQATLSSLDPNSIVYHVLEGICRYIRAERAGLVVADDGLRDRVRFQMHRLGTAESEDQVGSRSITPEMRGWLDRAVQDRASACTDMPRDVQGWLGGSSGRALCIPLRRDSSLTGVVFVIDWAVEDVEHRLPELDRLVTRVDVALHNARLVDRVTRMSEETVEALARAIDATSTWTAGHSKRVTRMAMTLGRELRLNADALDRLYRGGMLHDVGKLGVSGHVLDKPGKLTAEEFEQVRRHPVLGATILGPLSVFRDIIPLIEQHHEKFDGTGYPEGLTGPEIALEARVLAVADVFDALISSRPYRAAMPLETVVEIIERDSGSHFDPYVVDAFMDLYRRDALPLSEVAAAAAAPEREADPVAPGSR